MTRHMLPDRRWPLADCDLDLCHAALTFLSNVEQRNPQKLIIAGKAGERKKNTILKVVNNICTAMGVKTIHQFCSKATLQEQLNKYKLSVIIWSELIGHISLPGMREFIESRDDLYLIAASTVYALGALNLDTNNYTIVLSHKAREYERGTD